MKYAFCGGKLLDGTREMQPREGLVLRTDGDRITDIVPEGTDLTGYEVVNLKGGYLMPGLINMHVHLAGSGKPQKKQRYNGNVVFEGIIDCAKAALEQDIPVVLGNDVGCPWITQYDFWRELYYFHKYVGVSNAFALYTATGRSAQLAGIGQETGTLEPGKAADLIVTAADPLADLQALRHVELVMSHGQLHRAPQVKHRKNVEAELDRFL